MQSPLPAHIDEDLLIEHISADKDVDGFHPYNIGRLAIRQPTLRSCTPFGVIKMLQAKQYQANGLRCGDCGRIESCRSPNGARIVVSRLHHYQLPSPHQRFSRVKLNSADLVVAAAGKPGLIQGDWIKTGCDCD